MQLLQRKSATSVDIGPAYMGQKPYTAREVAELTARTTDTIYRWVRKGCIPHRRLQGTSLIFPRQDIDAWLAGTGGAVVEKQEGQQ